MLCRAQFCSVAVLPKTSLTGRRESDSTILHMGLHTVPNTSQLHVPRSPRTASAGSSLTTYNMCVCVVALWLYCTVSETVTGDEITIMLSSPNLLWSSLCSSYHLSPMFSIQLYTFALYLLLLSTDTAIINREKEHSRPRLPTGLGGFLPACQFCTVGSSNQTTVSH